MVEGLQYNAIPEGVAVEGGQKRRTEFASLEEWLAYDAKNLIELAQAASREKGIAVSPADLITREDDDVNALRRAIAIQLKTKPKYEDWVDGLALEEGAREKLKAMLSPKEYGLSVEAARELGATEVPSRDQIAVELMQWPVERLQKMCAVTEKPTLSIVGPSSFDGVIDAMNAHKHYRKAEGGQGDAFVSRDEGSPYVGAAKFQKGSVDIVDGVVHRKRRTEVSPVLETRREHLTREFAAAGMRHIGWRQMQSLAQRSLIEADRANDNTLIVDNWEESERESGTFIDPESLSKSNLGAFYLFSIGGEAAFDVSYLDIEVDYLWGRASVQVMEF